MTDLHRLAVAQANPDGASGPAPLYSPAPDDLLRRLALGTEALDRKALARVLPTLAAEVLPSVAERLSFMGAARPVTQLSRNRS